MEVSLLSATRATKAIAARSVGKRLVRSSPRPSPASSQPGRSSSRDCTRSGFSLDYTRSDSSCEPNRSGRSWLCTRSDLSWFWIRSALRREVVVGFFSTMPSLLPAGSSSSSPLPRMGSLPAAPTGSRRPDRQSSRDQEQAEPPPVRQPLPGEYGCRWCGVLERHPSAFKAKRPGRHQESRRLSGRCLQVPRLHTADPDQQKLTSRR